MGERIWNTRHNEDTIKQRYNLWGVVMRVEGVSLDIINWNTEFDLVEVVD